MMWEKFMTEHLIDLFRVSSSCMLIVIIAMIIDLASGLWKAHLRGEVRRSEALKRTGSKFCVYVGSMCIATGVDVMVFKSNLFVMFGWDALIGVPLVTIAIGVFWCAVEFMSVREKADEKTHSNIAKTEKVAIELLKLLDAIRKGEVTAEEVEQIINNGQKT